MIQKATVISGTLFSIAVQLIASRSVRSMLFNP
jgi:hypothetical protein